VTLILEEKQKYVSIINKIWSGSMNYNSVDNITEEVADEITFVLDEIKKCSENIDTLLEMLMEAFGRIYAKGMKWRKLIKEKAVKPGKKTYVQDWLDELQKDNVYNACVVTAAVNWKSSVQMKLMGL